LRFVVSHGAVFEFQAHGCLLQWNENLHLQLYLKIAGESGANANPVVWRKRPW
jgi:hypothetical protein